MERVAQRLALDAANVAAVSSAVRAEGIDLVVVGPEAPLVAGVSNAVRALGVPVFGPDAAAAQIEGSKAFAKEIMVAAGVPTADSRVFDDLVEAARVAAAGGPVVVKADGLAAGKGVVVADSGEEAAQAVRALGQLPAGKRVLLEERLEGPELSVMAICDGERAVLLPPSQDHKRLRDGDLGPNTGGMGAYAPALLLGPDELEAIRTGVILATIRELKFNARLGDPETQVLMMQTKTDLLPLFLAAAKGDLKDAPLEPQAGASVGIVLAAPGYPEGPIFGAPISGLEVERPGHVHVFHAGTTRDSAGRIVTAGGRVLTVCAQGASIADARAIALEHALTIDFPGRQLRRDIAARAPPV
jgi:phosphoribosylamine--glycine ligase